MRRIAATAILLVVIGGAALLATGASNGPKTPEFWVELDNAFGLVKGGDMKVAGVRAGIITHLELDQNTNRARIGFKITENGFDSLRTDVTCESRPQSLIGEYFLDCNPGTNAEKLQPGTTIPVTRTASTVAPDLVNDVLRVPYRQRLSIIVNELGAGVAGNGKNLNDAIRRAAPALRETDKVLETLGRQNTILRDLIFNADRVVGDLAANKADVQRWIKEAGNTATISATRQREIAAGFRELPGFLEQLRPAMAALGDTARNQTPALRNLDASATQLKTLFDRLGPFANASRPAIHALAQASHTGDQAVKAAGPTVDLLNTFSKGTPELGKNLAIILEHLDDRGNAAEYDNRAPIQQGITGPSGYSGLEALLQYVFDQTTSTNAYDQNSHILAVGLFVGNCADYADKATGLKRMAECGSYLGPTQPGLTSPDPYAPAATRQRKKEAKQIDGQKTAPVVKPAPVTVAPTVTKPSVTVKKPVVPGINVGPIHIPPLLPNGGGLGHILGDGGPLGGLGLVSDRATSRRTQTNLLNYLLAP